MEIKEIQGEHGIISRIPTGAFGYHAWGTVTRLTDGTLAAACSGGRVYHVCPFGKSMLFLSRDEGKTWSAPIVVNDTWLDDRDVGLTALPNGGLLMSWFNSDFTLLDERAEGLRQIYTPGEQQMIDGYRSTCVEDPECRPGMHVRMSPDGGLTWGEVVNVPVSAPHGPILLKDETIFYFGRCRDGIAAYRSADGGYNWEFVGQPPLPENILWSDLFEPHAIELPSGRIVGVMRCEAGKKLSMYVTWSDDGGKTWIVPRPMGVSGAPGHLMRHSSGALLCSYGRREHRPENLDLSERVLVSWDDGETWTEDLKLREAPTWDLGYPSTVELKDGSLLTAYYQRYAEGDQVDEKPSFLFTKWRLK